LSISEKDLASLAFGGVRIFLLTEFRLELWVKNISLEVQKKVVRLIGPTHISLIMNLIIRTMREKKFMLLNLYGHSKLNHFLVHRLSGKKKFVLPLMFLSMIIYLMNFLKTGTLSYLMPYRVKSACILQVA
jgi:hypothetical protein